MSPSARALGAGLALALAASLVGVPLHAQDSPSPPGPEVGLAFDSDFIDDLPLSGDLFALIETVQPEMISDRFSNGGMSVGAPARLGGFLGPWNQTLINVDGVEVTDPGNGGTPLLFPDLFLWNRVEVTTGLMPANVNAPALSIALQPRRPGNRWTRSAWLTTSHGRLAGGEPSTTAPALVRLSGFDRAAIAAAGPLVANRLGLSLGTAFTRGSTRHRAETASTASTLAVAFGHLVFTPTAQDDIRVLGWLQRAETPFALRTPFAQPDASGTSTAAHAQAVWERRAETILPWRVSASYTGRDSTPGVDLGGPEPVVERLTDGPVSLLASVASELTHQWSLSARISPSTSPTGRGTKHALEAGVSAEGARVRSGDFFTGFAGERVDTLAARIWRFSAPGFDSIRERTMVGLYLADRLQLGSRLRLDGAIRLDRISASAEGASTEVTWQSWLPKASVRWNVTGAWRTDLLAGYSRAGYRLPLDVLAVGDPAAPTAEVWRWPSFQPFSEPFGLAGPLVARMGPGTGGNEAFSRIDPDLKRPHSDELIVGIETRPGADLRVRLTGVARQESNTLALVNVGVPASSYSSFLVADPGGDVLSPSDDRNVVVYDRLPSSFGMDRYLLTNTSEDAATFQGLELVVEMAKPRFRLVFGATAGIAKSSAPSRGIGPLENDQGVLGEIEVNPNAATFARGRPFTDRAYTAKVAAALRFPHAIHLGAIARYQDGQPFSRMLVFPGLNQGTEAVRAFAAGDSRFRFTGTLDLRLQKIFGGELRRMAAVLDVYNVFGLEYDVEERLTEAPDVRIPTAVQPPRAVHLGVKVSF